MELSYKNTQQQIIMDKDDFTQVMDEFADKLLKRLQDAQVTHTQDADDDGLMTAKEVRDLIGVTDKTLHVWGKTGFLPRLRIGGVVRYKRQDVQRVAQVKGK